MLTWLSFLLLDALEIGCKLLQNNENEEFSLTLKASGDRRAFHLVKEELLLDALDRNGSISKYDMHKLEVEYDYDTD